MGALVSFPNPVNEKAARTVAGLVLLTSAVALLSGAYWLLAPMAVGFALRVLSGPRFSPFGLLATKLVAPRLGEPRLVAGPPKRFAQAMGLAMTSAGAVLWLGFGSAAGAQAVLAALIVAAGLESIFALCLGCKVFAGLMRLGVVPEETCERCANFALPAGAGS